MSCPTSPSRITTARDAPCRRPWPSGRCSSSSPFAFSGICTGELSEIRDDLGPSTTTGSRSGRSRPTPSLLAWADKEGYFFPLLSDFWPHGGVAASLGILHERGFAVRGTFLVDADRVIRWALVNGPGERRDFDAYRRVMATVADPGGTA